MYNDEFTLASNKIGAARKVIPLLPLAVDDVNVSEKLRSGCGIAAPMRCFHAFSSGGNAAEDGSNRPYEKYADASSGRGGGGKIFLPALIMQRVCQILKIIFLQAGQAVAMH